MKTLVILTILQYILVFLTGYFIGKAINEKDLTTQVTNFYYAMYCMYFSIANAAFRCATKYGDKIDGNNNIDSR